MAGAWLSPSGVNDTSAASLLRLRAPAPLPLPFDPELRDSDGIMGERPGDGVGDGIIATAVARDICSCGGCGCRAVTDRLLGVAALG